jgi:hypothetical protein
MTLMFRFPINPNGNEEIKIGFGEKKAAHEYPFNLLI